MKRRDGLGRYVIGEDDNYFLNLNELDSYRDIKILSNEIRFPIHSQTEASKVVISYLK